MEHTSLRRLSEIELQSAGSSPRTKPLFRICVLLHRGTAPRQGKTLPCCHMCGWQSRQMAEPYDGHIATTDGPLTSIVYVAFSISIIHFFGGLGLKHLQHLQLGKRLLVLAACSPWTSLPNFLPNHWKAKQRCIDFVQIGLGV